MIKYIYEIQKYTYSAVPILYRTKEVQGVGLAYLSDLPDHRTLPGLTYLDLPNF